MFNPEPENLEGVPKIGLKESDKSSISDRWADIVGGIDKKFLFDGDRHRARYDYEGIVMKQGYLMDASPSSGTVKFKVEKNRSGDAEGSASQFRRPKVWSVHRYSDMVVLDGPAIGDLCKVTCGDSVLRGLYILTDSEILPWSQLMDIELAGGTLLPDNVIELDEDSCFTKGNLKFAVHDDAVTISSESSNRLIHAMNIDELDGSYHRIPGVARDGDYVIDEDLDVAKILCADDEEHKYMSASWD